MKKCTICRKMKDESEFGKDARGVGGLLCRCKLCEANRTRNRRLFARKAIITDLGSKCCKCGNSDERVLHIDHIDGGGSAERKGKSQLSQYRLMWQDMEKYQLLCANCHMIKTHENGEFLANLNPTLKGAYYDRPS